MPESPEVETTRRSLVGAVSGKTIGRGVVRRPAAVHTHTAAGFARAVRGAVIQDVVRRGKHLSFLLGPRALVFHHKLGGVARYHAQLPSVDTQTALVLAVTDGTALEFRELQLSSFHLVRETGRSPLEGVGIEPLSPTNVRRVPPSPRPEGRGQRRAVRSKDGGRDRQLVGTRDPLPGKLRPDRRVGSLGAVEARVLNRMTRETLRRAVEAGGEPNFHDAFGRRGRYSLAVYGRARQRCPACGATIRGGRFHGRPTCFCPVCQR